MQRIVDERDSYLESIIELEQDKDYLAYRLKNPEYAASESGAATGMPVRDKTEDVNLKNLTINELIINLVNNSSTICNMSNESGGQIDPATGLIDMNATNMKLLKLIDSINRHGLMEEGPSSEDCYASFLGGVEGRSKGLQLAETILSELRAKKELAGDWNQKIAIELVECKIRLKQLINEVEEKCECIEALKDEMDEVRRQFNKLRSENCELQQKAALANVYSDELESLREKVSCFFLGAVGLRCFALL